jgi:hypothetical protein
MAWLIRLDPWKWPEHDIFASRVSNDPVRSRGTAMADVPEHAVQDSGCGYWRTALHLPVFTGTFRRQDRAWSGAWGRAMNGLTARTEFHQEQREEKKKGDWVTVGNKKN